MRLTQKRWSYPCDLVDMLNWSWAITTARRFSRRSRPDSSKRSSVELKGWHNIEMPRRADFHRHINFRPGTLAISCMFIQFLLDAASASSGWLTDVIMDSSPPTHYAFLFLSLVSRAFSFATDEHDRCTTLMRSLKYGSNDSPRFPSNSFSRHYDESCKCP